MIENKSFSRNCDFKATTCEEHHGTFIVVKFNSKTNNAFKMQISLYGCLTAYICKLFFSKQFLKKIGLFCERALLEKTQQIPYST